MITQELENSFINNQRVVTQQLIYDKSDDLFSLANLQRRLEKIEKALLEPEKLDREEKEQYEINLETIKSQIIKYEEYLKNYDV